MAQSEGISSAFSYPYIFPIIIVIITWLGSVFLFYLQHKKSGQSKWLEIFRGEMANVLAIANIITPKAGKDDLLAFSKAYMSVQFLIDSDNKLHRQLTIALDNLQQYTQSVSYSNFDSVFYSKKCFAVVEIFRKIIKEEKKKMSKLF